MLPLLLMSALTQAREPDRIHGFRIGSCVGFSTECIAANIKLEYAGKYAGINLSIPGIPAWGAASLRVYPIPVRERPSMSWRPYGYGGVSMIIMAVGFSLDFVCHVAVAYMETPAGALSRVAPMSVPNEPGACTPSRY